MSVTFHEIEAAQVSITDYDISVIDIPFKQVVHLPFGAIKNRPSVILGMHATVDGRESFGMAEGTSLPIRIDLYDDDRGNISTIVTTILEHLGTDTLSVSQLSKNIGSLALGGVFATARMTVETAILDTVSRSKNMAMIDALNGHINPKPIIIPYGKSISETEPAEIVRATNSAIEKGAKRLKYKLSPQNYHDLFPVLQRVVYDRPDLSVMVDANGMFDARDAEHLRMLKTIDSLGLSMIEEPVSRAGKIKGLNAHRLLRSVVELNTPIAIDDAIQSSEDAEMALHESLADIINLKPGRVGSFLKCLEMADLARNHGSQVMVGGMYEATPGRMMTVTLAAYCASLGFTIPGDISLPSERLEYDIVDEDNRLKLNENYDIEFSPSEGWGYKI